jgi:hypothetical protein
MNNFVLKVKRFLQKLRDCFPSATPIGMREFEIWSESIIDTYQLPVDVRSTKFALATMLLRLGPTEAYKSKRFFFLSLRKAAAAQIGAAVMENIKNQQKAQQAAEVTANAVPANGSTQ